LNPDEFEVFCYLLLRREYPDERIFYYGKTGDGGRDILRPQSPKGCELIQCKRYEGNVGVDEIRKEMAKLYTNVFHEVIPDRPQCITFYVARDLTPQAKDLLRNQSRWIEAAEGALREHLRREPGLELLDFARTWWPEFGGQSEIDLTERVKRQPELRDEFFEIKKVIDGSLADVVSGFKSVLAEAGLVVSPAAAPITGYTWEDFFVAAEKEDSALPYLSVWPGLTPEARFEAPEEFPEILDSVHHRPLTILIGPPAAGKTFIAVQVLWEAFQRNVQIRWIAPATFRPTDGPIPGQRDSDMKQRIESLAAKLGTKRFRAPLDHHEFITVNLEPGSIVYIEDPFGKTDEEFEYSLHTYRFFDLDEFVAAIEEGAGRTGCHILLSSREGLFDRWQAERAKKGLSPLAARLIRISGDSYSYEQLESLSLRLAQARGLEHPDDVASEIYHQVEFPYEIESIVRGLPLDADYERAAAEAEKYRDGLKSALQQILVAETDPEALFMVILASGCNDPKTRYLALHRALDLPGDAKISLSQAIERYRSFVVRRPAFKFLDYEPDADEVYSPSHSIIVEAITEYFRARSGRLFLERLACALPQATANRNAIHNVADISLYLLSLNVGSVDGPAAESILDILLGRGGLSLDHVHSLMRLWNSLSANFKERLFAHLKAGLVRTAPKKANRSVRGDGNTLALLIEMASNLSSVDLPTEDAWKLTRLLFRKEVFKKSTGPGLYAWESPWSYLFEHFEEAPADILRILEKLAAAGPEVFVCILGEVAVAHWKKLPQSYKACFFAESSLRRLSVQKRALQGIAKKWEEAPAELRDLFIRQAASEDPEVRVAAMTAAWTYWHRNPVFFDSLLMKAVQDPDIRVPLRILDASGERERDQRFAEALLERVRGAEAAEMLRKLLEDGLGPEAGWKMKAAKVCLERGGDLALAVLANGHFERHPHRPTPLWAPHGSLAQEPEAVRLGALHAWAHLGNGERDFLLLQEAIALTRGLSRPYRYWVLYYFSIQAVRLPPEVRAYIDGLEGGEGEDGDAVRHGKRHREPEDGWSQWRLPVLELARGMRTVSLAQSSDTESPP
jgi:hypothetical protein